MDEGDEDVGGDEVEEGAGAEDADAGLCLITFPHSLPPEVFILSRTFRALQVRYALQIHSRRIRRPPFSSTRTFSRY